MSVKDVFISYKAEEFEIADWVKSTLEQNGISCWMAPMSIEGGKSYAYEIPKAIRECRAFVLILSKRAQESIWVPRELDQAITAGKIVLPFMMENCELRDDFNFYLTNVQRYEAYESKKKAIEKMVREIRAILDAHAEEAEPKKSEPEKETTPAPEKKEKKETLSGSEKETEKAVFTASCEEAEKDSTPTAKDPGENSGKTKKQKKDRKSKPVWKKACIALGALAAAVVVMLIVSKIFREVNTVVIAGREVTKDETHFWVTDKDLTADDVKNIKKLNNLQTLEFQNCPQIGEYLGEILNTVDCDRLATLKVTNCGLTDEQLGRVAFARLNLSRLDLSNNNLTDLQILSTLADTLGNLNFDGNMVTDLTFLEGFGKLTVLSAAGNGIEEASSLASLTDLTQLCLDGSSLKSLDFLSAFQKLETLSVSNTGLSSLKGIEQNIKLETICADDNSLTSLEGLENATILNTVSLNNNQISDLSLLKKSSATLKEVYVSGNQIETLDPLSGCSSLKYLWADENKLTDLSALSGCTGLSKISVSGNQITSISSLSNAKELFYIDLSENQIADGSEILSLSLGTSVDMDLSNNHMTITGIPAAGYSVVDLHGNTVSSTETLLGNEGWMLFLDYKEGMEMEYLAQSGFGEFYLVDCPLDQRLRVQEILGQYSVTFLTEEEVCEYKGEMQP